MRRRLQSYSGHRSRGDDVLLERHRRHLRLALDMTVAEALEPAAFGSYTRAAYMHLLIERDRRRGVEHAPETAAALRHLKAIIASADQAPG